MHENPTLAQFATAPGVTGRVGDGSLYVRLPDISVARGEVSCHASG